MTGYVKNALAARIRITLRLWLATYRTYKQLYHPFLDLLIRFGLAQAFFVSGIIKVTSWDTALYLSAHEYPVSWMDPVTAAYVGVSIELICPIFLLLGLFTRLAALPMAILALVIQFNYQSLDTNVIWAALLFSYVILGPRALSFDALMKGGLRDSALPLAARLVRFTDALETYAGPVWKLIFRTWIGMGLLRLALPETMVIHPSGSVPEIITFSLGVLLMLGLGTPIINKLLVGVVLGAQLMTQDNHDTLFTVLLLTNVGILSAGPLSLDELIYKRLLRWLEPSHGVMGAEHWPRIVVVGAGFGGIACVTRLKHLPVQVTLIDKHNYHLFQPLLYQVATAALSPADIATPIRSLFRDDPNVSVLLGHVTGIDKERREVRCGDKVIPYDTLIVATGASHSYFGKDEWGPYAPGLKQVDDATAVRARVLAAFEKAESTDDPVERERLLRFVVVGAGPTGVELAGAIAELARYGLANEYRNIKPEAAEIILVQSGPRILPAFPEGLAAHATTSLERLGVKIEINSRVQEIDAMGVMISGKKLLAGTVLWAAGVVASPAAKWLECEADNAGRVKVGADLSVPGYPDIFVIGDTAASNAWDGKPVPGLAPAAKQGGEYVARLIRARLEGRDPIAPFEYKHIGSLATIGRKSAVADFGWLKLWGTPAWWLWGGIHVAFLVGLRNRISVMIEWMWAYLTFRAAIRLITGAEPIQKNS